jgi:hypothetical protein
VACGVRLLGFEFETYDSKPERARTIDDPCREEDERLISRDGPVPSVTAP